MTEAERIDRLNAVLQGTGATVNGAFGIWALNSQLADYHLAQLAGWADLRFLMADYTQITDASMVTICGFRQLNALSIGGNSITSETLAACDFPPNIRMLGLHSIPLTDDVVASVCRCSEITLLNVNDCNLSRYALAELAKLPNISAIEALGADSTPETSKNLSNRYPRVLFRLRDGLWENGECLRASFPGERN